MRFHKPFTWVKRSLIGYGCDDWGTPLSGVSIHFRRWVIRNRPQWHTRWPRADAVSMGDSEPRRQPFGVGWFGTFIEKREAQSATLFLYALWRWVVRNINNTERGTPFLN